MRHRYSPSVPLCTRAILGISLLLVGVPGQAEIIFHQDFEDGLEPGSPSDGFYLNDNEYCCEHSVQNVATPAHEGERALFTTCVAGDHAVNGHRHRANLTTVPGGSIGGVEILPYDVDRWFGFSVYIPWESADVIGRTNIFNTHVQNWGSAVCTGEPGTKTPLSLSFVGPNFRWTGPGMDHPEPYYWRLSSNPPGQNESSSNGVFLYEPANEDVGRWVNFVFHIRHSYTPSAGFMEIWKDGESIYRNDAWDMSLCPIPQSCGNTYPKIGAGAAVIEVDSGDGLPIEVYYDSIRWGDENSSFEEVDPAQDEGIDDEDRTPPAIIALSDLAALPAGTTSATLIITTSEVSTCNYRYFADGNVVPEDTSYADMSAEYESIDGLTHTRHFPQLTQESDFWHAARCMDQSSNITDPQENIRISVLPYGSEPVEPDDARPSTDADLSSDGGGDDTGPSYDSDVDLGPDDAEDVRGGCSSVGKGSSTPPLGVFFPIMCVVARTVTYCRRRSV